MTENIKVIIYFLACVVGFALMLYLSVAAIGQIVGTISALMYSRKKRRQ